MTRGVSGMFLVEEDMATEKSGRTGQRMVPATMRLKESTPEDQKKEVVDGIEWRYLSRREERTVDASKVKNGEPTLKRGTRV